MHYYQDPQNRIQADLARRIRKIALQYDQIPKPPDEDFDTTLHLCLLQNLLTSCVELFDAMSKPSRRELGLCALHGKDSPWGLADLVIVPPNTFEGRVTVAQILRHIRNAMSHPTGTDVRADFSSTGYNSIPDTSKKRIASIVFCSSPDTDNNEPRRWGKIEDAESHLVRARNNNEKSLPDVIVACDSDGYYGLFKDKKPFARQFVAILSAEGIHALVLGLSNLLAQPADEHFDGKTVRQVA